MLAELQRQYPFLSALHADRLVRAYGTRAHVMLGDAASWPDLGQDFGATLTAREIDYLIEHEWARTADDIVWRRSKLGLRLSSAQIAAIDDWIASRHAAPQTVAQL